jgi:DNA-3-methyladenine glycosylase I
VWVDLKSPIYIKYHDCEWGIPVYDDSKLFEMLILEGFQAGLSWITILNKRDNFNKAFDNFDYVKISNYKQEQINKLLLNDGIIRNKLKINSAISNARAFINIQAEYGSFSNYIWSFVNNKPIINSYTSIKDVPVNNKISDEISKSISKYGMKFVGSTIIYSFMQAVGMVNDHTTDCFRHPVNII